MALNWVSEGEMEEKMGGEGGRGDGGEDGREGGREGRREGRGEEGVSDPNYVYHSCRAPKQNNKKQRPSLWRLG